MPDAPNMGGPVTVFTILLENHDYNEIVGNTAAAPYINNTLIAQGGLATNYMDSGSHPSLPNYLYLVSGSTQGAFTDVDANSFGFPVNQPNLGGQLQTAGIPWRSYQESMGTACKLTSSGLYAPKHDGFLYFTDIQNGPNNLCANTNVDYSSFAADLAAGTYRFMWITPNLNDDGHNGTNVNTELTNSDTWLSQNVPAILNSPVYQAGNAILFITWDEAEGRNGDSADQVPMIVMSKRLKSTGMQLSTSWSHASWLATVEDIFGLPRLATVSSATNMMTFFNP